MTEANCSTAAPDLVTVSLRPTRPSTLRATATPIRSQATAQARTMRSIRISLSPLGKTG